MSLFLETQNPPSSFSPFGAGRISPVVLISPSFHFGTFKYGFFELCARYGRIFYALSASSISFYFASQHSPLPVPLCHADYYGHFLFSLFFFLVGWAAVCFGCNQKTCNLTFFESWSDPTLLLIMTGPSHFVRAALYLRAVEKVCPASRHTPKNYSPFSSSSLTQSRIPPTRKTSRFLVCMFDFPMFR